MLISSEVWWIALVGDDLKSLLAISLSLYALVGGDQEVSSLLSLSSLDCYLSPSLDLSSPLSALDPTLTAPSLERERADKERELQ